MLRVGSNSWPFSFLFEVKLESDSEDEYWQNFGDDFSQEQMLPNTPESRNSFQRFLEHQKKRVRLMMTCTSLAGFQLRRSGTTSSVLQNKTLLNLKKNGGIENRAPVLVFQQDYGILGWFSFFTPSVKKCEISISQTSARKPKGFSKNLVLLSVGFSIQKENRFFRGGENQACNSRPDDSLSWTLAKSLQKTICCERIS